MRRMAIIQGEQLAVAVPDTVITTLLGSCIAVCLYDQVARVGGMNHFLLGQPDKGQQVSTHDMQRYGVHAMELLINAMMQKGAARPRLRAHIYGGASIIAGLGAIGTDNAEFARRFIATEGIAVGHTDVGGTRARKVEFLAYEGKARSTFVVDPVPIVKAPAPVDGGDLELF
ncbi:chemotaxis protein CheD [Sphingomonas sp.]|jgi:chemotaxis protein CheD|uniref:chemotaxis protein CheD n=1 Tax=Sphingomonas sp. TaxID=28214 RepID=UPI002ED9D3ED